MLHRCEPDDIGISVSDPLPGTRFHERVADQLGSKRNWNDSSDLDMLYEGPFATAFYRQLHTVIHKDYKSARALWQLNASLHGRGPRPSPKTLARAALDRATLPVAQARLRLLEKQPHQGVRPIGATMARSAAAEPSPQQA